MHIIFLNTKSGVGKSTLCKYSYHELTRLGCLVETHNTEQQCHLSQTERMDETDFILYDTTGAFTDDNIDLLHAAAELDDVVIVVPITTGHNQVEELDFMISSLNELKLLDKTRFVLSKVCPNTSSVVRRKMELQLRDVNIMKWSFPLLEDFSNQRHTSRTRNEVSQFLKEIVSNESYQ